MNNNREIKEINFCENNYCEMASEPIHIASAGDPNMDYQMVAQIVDGLRKEQKMLAPFNSRLNMHTELRTLTFWRWVFAIFKAATAKEFINHE